MQLVAYIYKHFPKWGRHDLICCCFHTSTYVTIQVVILVRLPVRYPVTCLFTFVYTLGKIFVTFYALMLTPSMPKGGTFYAKSWDLTATLQ